MGGPPVRSPGRSLEAYGNVRPRWMVTAEARLGTGSGLQAHSEIVWGPRAKGAPLHPRFLVGIRSIIDQFPPRNLGAAIAINIAGPNNEEVA